MLMMADHYGSGTNYIIVGCHLIFRIVRISDAKLRRPLFWVTKTRFISFEHFESYSELIKNWRFGMAADPTFNLSVSVFDEFKPNPDYEMVELDDWGNAWHRHTSACHCPFQILTYWDKQLYNKMLKHTVCTHLGSFFLSGIPQHCRFSCRTAGFRQSEWSSFVLGKKKTDSKMSFSG